MTENRLNICQVSLARDIPLIKENFMNFKKIYKNIKIFIICPKNHLKIFKSRLNFKEIEIIDENKILSFRVFESLFNQLSSMTNYKIEIKKRTNWYYQQILKISFVLRFIYHEKKNIIIWDADTIILKKIEFFRDNKSVLYGTLFEFHKPYYLTNNYILKKQYKYFISFLTQFIAISVNEGKFIFKKLLKKKIFKEDFSYDLSKLILLSIFQKHKLYNGSLFSEYEMIGQINYIMNKRKQLPILTLRNGLNGKLTNLQIFFCIFLNYKHVTYEHSYINKDNRGMLNRKQGWIRLIKILTKNMVKFYFRKCKHDFNYYFR